MTIMLSFDAFVNKVKESFLDFLPEYYREEGGEVVVKEVLKNNDTTMTGIQVIRDSEKITTCMYLDGYYKEYVKRAEHPHVYPENFEDILKEMAENYVAGDNFRPGSTDEDAFIEGFLDFESVKDKILPRLVNKESNSKRLKDMPYKDFENLAITYAVMVGGDGSITINNAHLEHYGITADELHEIAIANLKNQPSSFVKMARIIAEYTVHNFPNFYELSPEEVEEAIEEVELEFSMEGGSNMFVLSNENKSFGAAELLNEEEMKNISERLEDDFYILPSSVHEVILIPAGVIEDKSKLEEMVREVNATQVPDADILSNSVYFYNKKENAIKIA